jgi:hypothetical protein
MLFYVYDGDFNVSLDFLDGIEISLWILCCFVLAYMGYVFIKETRRTKMFIFMGLFFILNIGARIVRMISKFIVGHEYAQVSQEGAQLILSYFYISFTYTALFFYYIYLERDVLRKSHHFVSTMVIATFIITVINYFIPAAIVILIIPFLIAVLGVPGCYVYVAWVSTGDVRRNAILMFLGLLLIIFGITFDAPTTQRIWINVPLLPEFSQMGAPSLMIIGALTYRYSFHLTKEVKE